MLKKRVIIRELHEKTMDMAETDSVAKLRVMPYSPREVLKTSGSFIRKESVSNLFRGLKKKQLDIINFA